MALPSVALLPAIAFAAKYNGIEMITQKISRTMMASIRDIRSMVSRCII